MEIRKDTSKPEKPHNRRALFVSLAAAAALVSTITIASWQEDEPSDTMRCEPYIGRYSLGNVGPGLSSAKIAEKMDLPVEQIAKGRLVYVACPDPITKQEIDDASKRVSVPGFNNECLPVGMGSPELFDALRQKKAIPEPPKETADIIVACPQNIPRV